MTKRLLVIGAGKEACVGLKKAKEMGLYVIAVDGDANAPGRMIADTFFHNSTYDPQAIIQSALAFESQTGKIDGVIAMCADVPFTVASVSEALGLPGLSLDTAKLVSDKLLMKEALQASAIPIPRFTQLESPEDYRNYHQTIPLPIVMKPVDSRGARGVSLVTSLDQIAAAWKDAKNNSPSQRVMIEEYLPGPQISTEALVIDGTCHTLGFSDRNYEWLERYSPHIIENGGDMPSNLSSEQVELITEIFEQAALALGIRNGVAKGDMVMTPNGAKVIEIAGRLSGGYFSSIQIPLSTGVDFVAQAIQTALDTPPTPNELTPKSKKAAVIRYLNPAPGKVNNIEGETTAANIPGVEYLQIDIRIGDTLAEMTNHTKRAGLVITTGETRQEAIRRAEEAISTIKVSTTKESHG